MALLRVAPSNIGNSGGSFYSRDYLRNHAELEFVSYHSNNPESSFAGQVWINNAWIAALCVASGILGVFVPAASPRTEPSVRGLPAGPV